ncbi:MAG: NADH-quinone oxidoreductase subunit C [Gammaproteobacteria bacterium]|nr:NADH-quinone oxidoreductase subunit C [Gammaproteobacteria bacterium]
MASNQNLLARINELFGEKITTVEVVFDETTVVTTPQFLLEVARGLRDTPDLRFEQLIDLCGVDYSTYAEEDPDRTATPEKRFCVVYHLLSTAHNHRLRMKLFIDGEMPVVSSVVDIWNSANWYEREAFDLFGIIFEGHPDLRRLLTDYGFIGHPFRKDFPLLGHVEVRYDPDKGRVVYEPVSIEPRVLVPRVVREEGFGDRNP